MKKTGRLKHRWWLHGCLRAVLFCVACALCGVAGAQTAAASQPEALAMVRAAVAAELATNHTDQSIWMYRDQDDQPGKSAVYQAVETRQGELRRMVALNGKPLSQQAEAAEELRIEKYVNDPAAQARARKNGEHDGEQAAELLKMLPDAFIWTIASQTPEYVTLNFAPDARFNPPDMQSRVMGQMGGEIIVARSGNRIRTLKGRLTQDVLIGFGILGKLNQGGTFDVERRQVGGTSIWQITETHVHIGGHALLFKTIGSQQDEVKTEWQASRAENLQQAREILGIK